MCFCKYTLVSSYLIDEGLFLKESCTGEIGVILVEGTRVDLHTSVRAQVVHVCTHSLLELVGVDRLANGLT